MAHRMNRRSFAKAGGVAAVTFAASSAARVHGANERIRLGFLGAGNRGCQLIRSFQKHEDALAVAVCDVHEPARETGRQTAGGQVATYRDFRQVLERPDIDAVVISTPDHWHAIMMIQACRAGMDVFVEKPLSATIYEGRKMVEAARRHHRVVQVGTHRRSSRMYADVAERISRDDIGKVTISRAFHLSNMYPLGIGKSQPTRPPKDLDWDLWLGPRPEQDYQDNITPYKFRWWHLFSSQMANFGVHRLDVIRWLTGELAPSSICAMGGRFAVNDDRTIPDTLQATFEFASGRLAVFGQYEASQNLAIPISRELARAQVEFRGTQGTLYIGDRGYEILPERGGQFQEPGDRMEPERQQTTDGNLTDQHTRNFLDCVKSRDRPTADVEIGHRSTTFSLLANISWQTRLRIEWDAQQERILNSPELNDLLHYEYRKPWTLE
jgi:predicted dehydrogenase